MVARVDRRLLPNAIKVKIADGARTLQDPADLAMTMPA